METLIKEARGVHKRQLRSARVQNEPPVDPH